MGLNFLLSLLPMLLVSYPSQATSVCWESLTREEKVQLLDEGDVTER